MPRAKGSRRSLAAQQRRAEQLAAAATSQPLTAWPDPTTGRGTGSRHNVGAQNWPTSAVTGKCYKLSIPEEDGADRKFVLVIGNSHLRSLVDGFVPMSEACFSFGYSSTPGGTARDLYRQLSHTELTREPHMVLILATGNIASWTVSQAAVEFGRLLALACSRWQRVCVLGFPPRLAVSMEVQTLLDQEYHRVSARLGIRYFSVLDHFPMERLELWYKDGVHLSDDHGMWVLASLLWQCCFNFLETPAPPPAPVSPPPSRPSTRRVQTRVVVTGPVPAPPPPPPEWRNAGRGRKKNQPRTPKRARGRPKRGLVQRRAETVFSLPPSPLMFSPAILVEMDKISPSHLGSVEPVGPFPSGKKTSPPGRRIAVARRRLPRGAAKAAAGEERPRGSTPRSPPGAEEHKPIVDVRGRRSRPSSSPGVEVRPRSPARPPPASEEDQAVVEVTSPSPRASSDADGVKGLSPVVSTSRMAGKRHSPASTTSGMEDNVSRETKKPASKRRRPKRQAEAVLEVRTISPASSSSDMEVDQEDPGVVEVIPGTSPTSVTILDICLDEEPLEEEPQDSEGRIPSAPSSASPIATEEVCKDKSRHACVLSQTDGEVEVLSTSEEVEVLDSPVSVSSAAVERDVQHNPAVVSNNQPVQLPDNISGSFHQGAEMFQRGGRQCMAIALVALAKHTISSVFSWNQDMLDWVLLVGDNLYNELYTALSDANRLSGNSGYLMVSNLPKRETIDGQDFTFVYGNCVSGDAAVKRSAAIDIGAEVSLSTGLELIMSEYDLCLFTFCGTTCAIISDSEGHFAVVDSHSRNNSGFVAEDGKSVVAYFGSFIDLLNYLLCVAASSERKSKPFELQGVAITLSNKQKVLKRLRSSEQPKPLNPVEIHVDLTVEEPDIPELFSNVMEEESVNVNLPPKKKTRGHNRGMDSDVQFVSEESNSLFFNPLSESVCQSLCKQVNIPFEKLNIQKSLHIGTLGVPCLNETIVGDGNCYFRAISQAVSGTQKNHRRIRLAIVKEMEQNPEKYQSLLPDWCFSVKDYIAESNMRRVGTWATAMEIQATANYFGVDIYTFLNNNWVKYACDGKLLSSEGVYLENCHGNHFETVVCVKMACDQKCHECCKISVPEGYNIRAKDDPKTESEQCIPSIRDRRREKRKRWLQKRKEDSKLKYEDVNHSNKKKQESKIMYEDALHREKKKELSKRQSKLMYEDVQYRERKKASTKGRYEEDAEHRERKKAATRDKYEEDSQYRERKKAKSIRTYRDSLSLREKLKTENKLKYSQNRKFKAQVKEANNKRKMHNRNKEKDIEYVIDRFLLKVQGGPDHVCAVCFKLFFGEQVRLCNKENYRSNPKVSSVAEVCISEQYLHKCVSDCPNPCRVGNSARGKLWICFTCNTYIRRGQMPPECHMNNMELDPIPPEVACLNSLEHHLCCPTISFIRAMALPKGGQNAAHGPVTCVPANVLETTNLLPRTDMEGILIPIKLKRKLTYKGHYEYEFVDPMHVRQALSFFKQNNKHFKDINFNEDWVNVFCRAVDDHLKQDDDDVVRAVADYLHTEDNKGKETEDPKAGVSAEGDETSKVEVPEELEDEFLHDNQRHCIFPDTCLMPVDPGQEIIDQCFDDILNLAPAEGNNPLKLRSDEDHEAKCFPKLFPFARNTFHTRRPIKLTLFRYFVNRIFNVDRRFAQSSEYLFFALSMHEVDQVVSKVSIAARKGYGKGSTLPEDKSVKDSLKDMLGFDNGFCFLHGLKGSPPYWSTGKKELFAMVEQRDLPTWYCTFSAADLRWGELLDALLRIEERQQSVDSLTWEERCDLLRHNPVVAAQMFDRRWKIFLKDVIMSKAEPIGKIEDYFYRVEFQQRGSPHVHCLFWVQGAPKIGVNTDEEVTEFIDKYVTCELPTDDDELLEIVKSVQTHSKRHSRTCKKGQTACRFNFPRAPSMRTFIKKKDPKEKCPQCDLKEEHAMCTCYIWRNMHTEHATKIMTAIKKAVKEEPCEPVETLFKSLQITQEFMENAMKQLGGNTSIILKRETNEVYVNNYNKHLLKAWNANMDIQFVVNPWACIVYIISYISKAEREMGLLLRNTLKEAKKGNLSAQEAMKKMGSVYLHNREVSAQEAVYRLTNMHLKQCSRKVVFIPTGENIVRMSRPIGELSDETSPEDVWMTNIIDRYKNRPNNRIFNDMCIATFASEYRVLASTEKCNDGILLQNGMGVIVKRTRTKPAIIRYAKFSETKNPELFHLSRLQLFMPYRNEEEWKPSSYETFENFYRNGFIRLDNGTLHSVSSIVDANRCRYVVEMEDLDAVMKMMDGSEDILQDAWCQLCPEQEVERLESIDELTEQQQREDPVEQEDIPDLAICEEEVCHIEKSNNLPRDQGLALIRSLNDQQLAIFFKIRHWCIEMAAGQNPDPFYVYITGGAGTGKTHLIRAIQYEASRLLAPTCHQPDGISVLLTAPTGVAAYNIDGTTVHSTFNIPISIPANYTELRDDKLNSLRVKYRDLQVLIIDEISMVHHNLLRHVHGRLRQIKQPGDHSPFGKVSVIAVGDFYQLPPVYGSALYKPPEDGLGEFWNGLFKVAELNTIMRQKDIHFAQLLNRLRVRSRQTPLRSRDIDLLRQCETGEESSALHIFARNRDVDEYNVIRLKEVDPDFVEINAEDFSLDKKTGKLKKLEGHLAGATHTNLDASLAIGINARVMLCKNIDVADGLVNGVCGTVTHIIHPDKQRIPVAVYVKFDDPKVGAQRRSRTRTPADLAGSTRIEPEEDMATRRGEKRRQFPLKLAWACTVHKVQGMTVDEAVVSLKDVRTAGQAYVALSRVRSLEGLIIQDFNEQVIFCNDIIKLAMEHMPPFITEPSYSRHESDIVTLFFMNVQGLTQHVSDLASCIQHLQPNCIAVAETWLSADSSLETVQLDQYSFFSQPRSLSYHSSHPPLVSLQSQRHGGVGLYCDDTFIYEITVPPFDLECLAYSCVENELLVAVVYRPPSYPMPLFKFNLERLLSWLNLQSASVAVVGDFNENILKVSTLPKFMLGKGYTQCVTSSTTERGTLIDHVYVKSSYFHVHAVVVPTYFSDHEGVLCSFKVLVE